MFFLEGYMSMTDSNIEIFLHAFLVQVVRSGDFTPVSRWRLCFCAILLD
jgi:hypothetical protein